MITAVSSAIFQLVSAELFRREGDSPTLPLSKVVTLFALPFAFARRFAIRLPISNP